MSIGVSGPGIADGLFIKTGDPSTVDEAAMFADGLTPVESQQRPGRAARH